MITIIADHIINPGQAEAANKIFQEVSASAQKAKGLLSRQVVASQKNPNRVITVTSWQTQEAFDAWRNARKFSFDQAQLKKIFAKEEVEICNVSSKI